MKKRIAAMLLVFCLLACLLPAEITTEASGLCFVAINETLLDLSAAPYFASSETYLPYWVITSMGLSYSYFAESVTAVVYSANKQIFFDLSDGNTYDVNGNYYSTQAIFRNGSVYLPAKFLCTQFGYTYSYISGNEYGDIVRIKAGAILSDQVFLSAATSMMKERYNAYYGIVPETPVPVLPEAPPTTEVVPSPTPSPTPTPVDRHETTVSLSFVGLPTPAILEALERYNLKTTFFLSGEDVLADPELVRTLRIEGHSLGVWCGEGGVEEYEETHELLFQAARLRVCLAAADEAAEAAGAEWAEIAGLSFCRADILAMNGEEPTSATAVTSQIEVSYGRTDVRFDCGIATEEGLPTILYYLTTSKFTVEPLTLTSLRPV